MPAYEDDHEACKTLRPIVNHPLQILSEPDVNHVIQNVPFHRHVYDGASVKGAYLIISGASKLIYNFQYSLNDLYTKIFMVQTRIVYYYKTSLNLVIKKSLGSTDGYLL